MRRTPVPTYAAARLRLAGQLPAASLAADVIGHSRPADANILMLPILFKAVGI